MWSRVRSWLPMCSALAVGWLAVAIYSYPGFMSLDSIEQLAQARDRAPYSDWHPPVMPLIWHQLDRIVAGPLLFVLLQCGLLIGGLHAVLARVVRPWTATVASLLVFLFPPVFTVMAVVWKDSLMSGVLVASYAGLTSSATWARLTSQVGLLLALMLRYNAVFAVVPLLVALSPWPRNKGAFARGACGFGIAVALFVVGQLGNRALTEVRAYPFSNSLAPLDLVCVIHYADPLTDPEVEELTAGVPLAHHDRLQARTIRAYSPYGWWPIVRGPLRFMEPPANEQERAAVFDAWLRTIVAYPGAYARCRIRMFRALLGLSAPKEPSFNVFNAVSEDRPLLGDYGIIIDRGPFQMTMSSWLAKLSIDSTLFRGYPYLIVAIALVIAMRRRREAVALLASGLVYELALLIVAPSPDFRYSHWLVVCVLVALVMRIAIAWRRHTI